MKKNSILRNLIDLSRQQVLTVGQLGLVLEIGQERADNLARLLGLLIDTLNSEWNSNAEELNEIKTLVNGSIDTKERKMICKTLQAYTTKAEALLARMGEVIDGMPDTDTGADSLTAAAVTPAGSDQAPDPPAQPLNRFWSS